MSSSSDSISVAVRVRPAKNENDLEEWVVQDQVIYAAQPECQHNVFAFDHIFSQEKTNGDVYDQVVQPIISSVMAGYHGTVFAYGQTSSGKTHTMMGNDQDPGVIKRAIAFIYDEIHKATDREFLVRISYLEIYNEQIRDLLNMNATNLQIKGPDMAVHGLTEKVTTDAEMLLKFMTEGDKNRQVGCTNMNERSSRSHSIFRVTVESSNRDPETNKRDGVTVSQLNLVDLAGSERATQTGATGTRLREGCHINTSLTALGIVIRKLSTGEKHINFRDSKLTRILQNSLGGNSRTAIICNVSPTDYETTLSTLRFGSDAKRIKNKPMINQVISEDASLLRKRNKEIETLKELISKVEAGKEQQLKEKDETITQLKRKIEGLQHLAIGGELPVTVSDRNASLSKKADVRRRETWCPGQLVAATPAKASAFHENADSNDDSFIAKYGIYKDDEFDALCTPARPRKRQADEAFPSENPQLSSSSPPHLENEQNNLMVQYEEALMRVKALEEEIDFLRNEKKLCTGACTPPVAKRACIQQAPDLFDTPVTVKEPALSLIHEEESEEDSPFGQKLKIMATPRQKIQGMRQENKLLKRSLLAASSCASPAPSEDTVLTLCNRTQATPLPKVEMCDASCQYESTIDEPLTVDQVPCSVKVDVSTSPIAPVLQIPKLTPFSTPKRTPILSRVSRAESWITSETTPSILPIETRDAEAQVCLMESPKKEIGVMISTQTDSVDSLSEEIQYSAFMSDAETSCDIPLVRPVDEEAPKERIEMFTQTEEVSETLLSQGVQCSVRMIDMETSFDSPECHEIGVQTDRKEKTSPAVGSSIDKYSFVTRCMESPVSVTGTDGLRGLDALLPPAPARKVETKDVGVLARIEELWVIKMKLDQEKAAREEVEQKLDEVWKESRKLVNTNDKYLSFFKHNGIDPRSVISGELSTPILKSENSDTTETLRRKYETLKEFCFKHPDIKERVIEEKVLVRHRPTKIEEENLQRNEEIPNTSISSQSRSKISKQRENAEAAPVRPLVELEDLQQFRGVQYLSEANPGECKQS